jgi:hypothetical protein
MLTVKKCSVEIGSVASHSVAQVLRVPTAAGTGRKMIWRNRRVYRPTGSIEMHNGLIQSVGDPGETLIDSDSR